MSNLSTTEKANEIAICGVLRESIPFQSEASEVLESSSEGEGEIREDAGHGKRRNSPEEESPAKRIKGPEPDAFSFSNISNVRSRLYYVIRVNDQNPCGTFTAVTKGWMIRMFMDPGHFGNPSITLGFSKNGEEKLCRSTRDVDAYVQGEWAMDDTTFSCLHGQDPLSFDRCNY